MSKQDSIFGKEIPYLITDQRQIDRGFAHPSKTMLLEWCAETGAYTVIGEFKGGKFWNWLHRKFGVGLLLPVKTAKK
jgi:hypothetical protein